MPIDMLWLKPSGDPPLMMVGGFQWRIWQATMAGMDAERRFAGRDRRRVKREHNKARRAFLRDHRPGWEPVVKPPPDQPPFWEWWKQDLTHNP